MAMKKYVVPNLIPNENAWIFLPLSLVKTYQFSFCSFYFIGRVMPQFYLAGFLSVTMEHLLHHLYFPLTQQFHF